jgi:Methyltransferase domain/C-methyltransferase C-terminal domain
MRCPCCLDAELDVFFEQARVPLMCNVLLSAPAEARNAPTGTIRLGFCQACGMIYNTAFTPSELSYGLGYENSLHFSPRFQAYAEELAHRLIRSLGLYEKTVVEIGCGQGDFLRLLCQFGNNRGLGIDTTYAGEPTPEDAFTVVRGHYSEIHAHLGADLVCCRHVLEHVEQPRKMLREVHRAASIRPGTVVFFEVPNMLYTLRDLGIWDVIHEHCSYFSPASLERLFLSAGFTPERLNTTFGGQFICLETRVSPRRADTPPSTATDALEELSLLVAVFAQHFQQKVDMWSERLQAMLAAGRQIALWGAGSKGVSFLSAVQGGAAIACAVDVNPRKWGRCLPLSARQVVSPDELTRWKVDTVLVMNPLYEAEIRDTLDRVGCRAELTLV